MVDTLPSSKIKFKFKNTKYIYSIIFHKTYITKEVSAYFLEIIENRSWNSLTKILYLREFYLGPWVLFLVKWDSWELLLGITERLCEIILNLVYHLVYTNQKLICFLFLHGPFSTLTKVHETAYHACTISLINISQSFISTQENSMDHKLI